MSPEAIRALVAAGVSAEQLGAAMIAEAESAATAKAARRAGATERKRRQRARDADVTLVTRDERDIAGHDVTERDPFQDKESPPDPQRKPNYPVGSISTREGPTSDQLAKVAVLRQAFATFWAEYPRKKAKPDAERAYAKAVGRIGGPGDATATILAGLHRQLDGWATGPLEYVPHPATWLNRDGWNDEADQPRPPRQGARDDHHRPSPGFTKLSNVARAMREGLGDEELFGAPPDAVPH